MHRTTVSKWETELSITTPLDDDSEVKQVSRFVVHVVRGDAINSQQTVKIHSVEIKSMFRKLEVVHEENATQTYLDSILFKMKGSSAKNTHTLYHNSRIWLR